MKQHPAIVIPAYQRSQALDRLLLSLRRASFESPPPVLLSLEGGASKQVEDVAEAFARTYPNVTIVRHQKRLGLRAHILECGERSLDFGSVVILEEDLFVDPQFYRYACAALEFYADNPKVAGIALYSPEYNEFAALPFSAMRNGYDTYPMRVPCSWGQAWTANQWQAFRDWYVRVDAAQVNRITRLPRAVRQWPETSWKKYFAAYLTSQRIDFIYPFQSVVTNCSDPGGQHHKRGTTQLQVSLGDPLRKNLGFNFEPLEAPPRVAYDEFMEACGAFTHECLRLDDTEVQLDLYGLKPVELLRTTKFVATTRPARNPQASFELAYRPIEQNLRFPLPAPSVQAAVLLATADDIDTSRQRPSISELVFHTKLNLRSKRYALEVVKAIPATLLADVRRLIERRVTLSDRA